MSEVVEDGLIRSRPPSPALAIGKEKVLIAIAVIGALFAIGIVLGNRSQKQKTTEGSSQASHPGYQISTLPSSYAELPPPTPTPTPEIKIVEKNMVGVGEDDYFSKLEEERRKRAESAQRASVSFQGLTSSQIGGPSLPGSSESENGDGASEGLNSRDQANRQDEKNSYLKQKVASSVRLNQRILPQGSPYELKAGSLIPGLMLTGLNSDLPGQILGQVSQNVFDTTSGRHLLVPQGTKVLGQYDSRIVYGQERVLIVWTRLIFPNGESISLEGMPGVDLSGYAGLSDQVNNHWGRLLTGVVFSSLLSAGAQMAQGRTFSSVNPSFDELALQGVAKNANQVGQEITRRNLDVQPTLEIRPGFRFNVFVHKDMMLKPYGPSYGKRK